MPQPNEEPAIARVREAAARQGVTLDIVVMDASTHTAADAAAAVGAELGQIVKSLVFVADGRPVLVLTSGANRVDLKKVARLGSDCKSPSRLSDRRPASSRMLLRRSFGVWEMAPAAAAGK